MSARAIRLVIFDCDGVLVDTEQATNEWIAQQITDAGLPITAEACRKRFVGLSMSSVAPKLLAEGGPNLGEDFAARWWAAMPTVLGDRVQAVPYVHVAVDALEASGLAFCVASSGTVEKMHMTLGTTGLLPRLSDVLFSATMVEKGKPAPDLFLHAAQAMGVAPADCVVVEDSPYGAQAAAAAGMRCLGYAGDPLTDAQGLASHGATLFHDMRSLAGLLKADAGAPPWT
ncbi:MAG: HAD family phosphatase [Pseudomonadota bacterium]